MRGDVMPDGRAAQRVLSVTATHLALSSEVATQEFLRVPCAKSRQASQSHRGREASAQRAAARLASAALRA
jgi:hypothetical protein